MEKEHAVRKDVDGKKRRKERQSVYYMPYAQGVCVDSVMLR